MPTLFLLPPWVNTFLFTSFLLVVYWTYGSYYFYRDPNGIFYDSDRAYERKYSSLREAEADKFLLGKLGDGDRASTIDRFESQARLQFAADGRRRKEPSVCAVVVSFGDARDSSKHPLQTTIGTLIDKLDPVERNDLDLNVYIANTTPEQHPLYDQPLLLLADSVTSARDIASPSVFSKLVGLERSHDYINKTAYDFSLALQHCLERSAAPYIMLFEDDIVAAEGWFARTRSAIHDAEALAQSKQRDWLDLRLFNDAKNLRWNEMKVGESEWHMLTLILPLLIPTTIGFVYLVLRLIQKTKLGTRLYTMQSAWLFCLVSIPIFFIIFINTGYLVTMPQQEGVTIQSWGCCTQGEVLPRARVPLLIDALRGRASSSPADLTVWDLATENRLLRFVMNPPMVQHVGASSILTPDRPKKETVWSMAFEALDANQMQLEHTQLVEELYGDR